MSALLRPGLPQGLASLVVALALSACAGAERRQDPIAEPAMAAQAPARQAAVEPGKRPFEACRQPVDNQVKVIDETRRRVQETVCGAALWFDGLFGEGNIAAARKAHGRVELSVGHSEFDGWDTRLRFHARVSLPELENRLSAFVGRDDDEDFVRDRSEGLALRSQFPRIDDREEWLAGLGYSLPEAYRIKTDFRVGARSLREPTAFAHARLGYTAYSDARNLVHLRTTPFVNTRDGLGLTVSLDLDHALTATRLLRWGTIGTVSENSDGLDWRSAWILYQGLGGLRAVAYEAFLRGATQRPEPLEEYGLRTIFRHPVFKARLIGELVLGYSWPRVDPALSREGSFGISLGMEMPYGEDPD